MAAGVAQVEVVRAVMLSHPQVQPLLRLALCPTVEHEQRVDKQRWTIKYAYNAAGQLIGRTLPDGQQLGYRYRGSQHPRAGLLESVWLDKMVARPLAYGLNDETDTYTSRRFMFGQSKTARSRAQPGRPSRP